MANAVCRFKPGGKKCLLPVMSELQKSYISSIQEPDYAIETEFSWFPINIYGDIAKSLLDDEKDKICKMH